MFCHKQTAQRTTERIVLYSCHYTCTELCLRHCKYAYVLLSTNHSAYCNACSVILLSLHFDTLSALHRLWLEIQDIIGPASQWPRHIRRNFWPMHLTHWESGIVPLERRLIGRDIYPPKTPVFGGMDPLERRLIVREF